MKPYAAEMILTIVCSLLKYGSMLGAAGITSYMVGLAMERRIGDVFNRYLPLLIVCVLLRAVMYFAEMYFGHDVAFRAMRDFRLSLYKQVETLAPEYLLRERTGNLGQSFVGDVEVIELFLAHTFGAFIVAIITTILILAVLGIINLTLAAVMFVCAAALIAVPNIMKKRADAQGYDVRGKMADANAVAIEGIQGLMELMTLNFTERYKEKHDAAMNELYASQLRYGRRQGAESFLTQIFVGFFRVALMAITASMVSGGSLEFSLYPVTVLLTAMLLTPITEVASVAQSLGLVFASADRIQSVLSAEPVVKDSGKANYVKGTDIVFENVVFRYPNTERDVLNGINFTVNSGEVVALIGKSGAGKTTCANMLLRYWDVREGSVRIGEADVRDLTLEKLHEIVSAVPQDVYLFHTSVKENIRIGRPEATDDEVISSAKAADAHGFVSDLPDGYNTVTGERGFRLSGGQRQRIAIARALLKGSPIIVFDEPVANLDTESELYLQQSLRTNFRGKTVLMIAHRPSTIAACDRTIEIANGTTKNTPERTMAGTRYKPHPDK
jgi:ABC-type multidrug transport system fused ATPase/permease subunit